MRRNARVKTIVVTAIVVTILWARIVATVLLRRLITLRVTGTPDNPDVQVVPLQVVRQARD